MFHQNLKTSLMHYDTLFSTEYKNLHGSRLIPCIRQINYERPEKASKHIRTCKYYRFASLVLCFN